MTHSAFLDLSGTDWHATRDSMKQYARVVGKVRGSLAPPEKHWWHAALRLSAVGATTGPIPGRDGSVELLLNFANHALGDHHQQRPADRPAVARPVGG